MRELRGVGIPRAQSPHGKEATVMAGCGVNRPTLLPHLEGHAPRWHLPAGAPQPSRPEREREERPPARPRAAFVVGTRHTLSPGVTCGPSCSVD